MGVFAKYTKKSMLNNRTRTIVTIIGIILSVSLFTAVAEGLISIKEYAVERVYQTLGHFEAAVESDDNGTIEKIQNEERINNMRTLSDIGFSYIGSTNAYKPYLYVGGMSRDFTDLVSVRLTEGRMPENSGEILLPLHLGYNGGVQFKIGDTVTVQTGKRVFEGERIPRNSEFVRGETLQDTTEHTYTVVGFYKRFDLDIEDHSCPGYTALTHMEENQVPKDFDGIIFFTMTGQKYVEEFVDSFGDGIDSIINSELLLYKSGIAPNAGVFSLVTVFACVLFIIITFGCVALIYNSFSISVSERTKQFGILKSVGATKRQIVGTVLYEAVFLSIIAIPLGFVTGCAGIGAALYLLRDYFSVIMSELAGGEGLYLSLHVKLPVFVFVAVMGFLMTFISAIIPAARAIRIMPIDSIRQSGDIKISAKKVKTSKLTYKLFGFPGMLASKNLKRNRKKYRTAVLSLFVSVVLFISASSFTSYLVNAAETVADISDYDIELTTSTEITGSDLDKLYGEFEKQVLKIDGVESVVKTIVRNEYTSIEAERKMLDESYWTTYKELSYEFDELQGEPESSDYKWAKYWWQKYTQQGKVVLDPTICFIEDSLYENLLTENNIDIPTDGRLYGVLWDTYTDYKWSKHHIFKKFDSLISLKLSEMKPHIENYDYEYTDLEYDENGNITAKNYYRDTNAVSDSEENYIVLSDEEHYRYMEANIAGVLDTASVEVSSLSEHRIGPVLIYPESSIGKFASGNRERYNVSYYMKADDHNFVADELYNVIGQKLFR